MFVRSVFEGSSPLSWPAVYFATTVHGVVHCHDEAILSRNVCSADQSRPNSAINIQVMESNPVVLKKGRSLIVITVLSLVLFVNSVSTGILTVGIPRIATDLELSEGLLLW